MNQFPKGATHVADDERFYKHQDGLWYFWSIRGVWCRHWSDKPDGAVPMFETRWKFNGSDNSYTREQLLGAGWTDANIKLFGTPVPPGQPANPRAGLEQAIAQDKAYLKGIEHALGMVSSIHESLETLKQDALRIIGNLEAHQPVSAMEVREAAISEMERHVKTGLGLRALYGQLYDAGYHK